MQIKLEVWMAHDLQNASPYNGVDDCLADPAGGQLLFSQTYTLNPFGQSEWTTVGPLIFTLQNGANNQLYFRAREITANFQEFVCVDDVVLTTTQISPVQPSFASLYQGNSNWLFQGDNPNNQIAQWCWDFGDGSTGSGQNAQHQYAQAGTYNICLTIIDVCGRRTQICGTIEYYSDACDCASAPPIIINQNATWSGPKFVGNDVIIPPGKTLNISFADVTLNQGCKFVVMRGARLNIMSSNLTAACEGDLWEGIVVWGNDASHTVAQENGSLAISDPGVLKITRNSTISRARIAIQAQRWWGDRSANEQFYGSLGFGNVNPNNQAFRGGFTIADDSYFRNNRKSGEFLSFSGISLSRFVNNCEFTCSLPSCNGLEGVTIWETDGILFDKCTFENVRARGIVTLDGSMTVKRSNFHSNVDGIDAGTTATPNGAIYIGIAGDAASVNDFQNNTGSGVYSKNGILSLKVHENTFRLNGKGIYLKKASADVTIGHNTFNNHTLDATLFEGTGPGNVELNNCNVFEQNGYGINARQNNMGLVFYDNTFNNALGDVRLRSQSGMLGSIRLLQGGQGAPFWNLFSESEQINDIVATQQQSNFFYYYPPLYNQNAAVQARLIPDCDINDACPTTYNYFNQPLSQTNYPGCLDLERIGEPPLPELPCQTLACLQQLKIDIITLEQVINSGGNTVENKGLLEKMQVKLYRDKRLLVWQWRKDGNMADIVTLLGGSTDYEDQKLYYTVKLRNHDLTGAAALLNAMPEVDQDQVWFKDVQEINLDFRAAVGTYVLPPQQDLFLRSVAQGGTPAGASATGLYYLLTGEWVDDDEEEEDFEGGGEERNLPYIADFKVYPNPARDYVRIEFKEASGHYLTLTDPTGRTVLKQSLTGSPYQLLTAGLPNGIFTLRITDNSNDAVLTTRLAIFH